MFKLIVNGKNGREESDFATQAEAQAHFDLYRSKGHWGKEEIVIEHEEIPAITVEHPEIPAIEAMGVVLDEVTGEVVSPAIEAVAAIPAWTETISEAVPAWTEIIPAEFRYRIEDKTAEVQAEKLKQDTKKADRFSRVDQFKNIDWNTTDTIAELKTIVRLLVKEAIKDDE